MLNIILMFTTFNILNKKKSVFSFIVNLKKMYYATKESIKFFQTLESRNTFCVDFLLHDCRFCSAKHC